MTAPRDLFIDDALEPDAPECPACGGPGGWLGQLGSLIWFRCISCGIDFNLKETETC